MSKKRVYDLSKELNIPPNELLALIKDLGSSARGPMSIIDDSTTVKLQAHFEAQKQQAEKEKQLEKERELRLAEKGIRLKQEKEQKEREQKDKEKRDKEQEKQRTQSQDSEKERESTNRKPNVPPTRPNVPPTRPYTPPTRPNAPPTRPNAPPTRPNAPPTRPGTPLARPGTPPIAKPGGPPIAPKPGGIDSGDNKRRHKKKRTGGSEESKDQAARKKSREKPFRVVDVQAAINDEVPTSRRARRRKAKPVKEKKEERGLKEVQQVIRQTMAASEGRVRKIRRKIKETAEGVIEENRPMIAISEFTSVGELANMLGIPAADIIAKCLNMGLMTTINQRLDSDTITMIADEFSYDVELVDPLAAIEEEEDDAELTMETKPRAPVVTIMGHVDHGKTSLLDYIRKSNVTAGESGGITQHIGAYSIAYNGKKITFLDTPGHEAFTSMRARGAKVTDVVILVVSTVDSVMPQTIEAIDHAKAARVPIIIALNKVDLPAANPDKIRHEMTQHGLIVEDYGGETVSVEISAKTGQGVDRLLEMIVLQSELLELKASDEIPAKGAVIEARLDRGRGAVATILVQKGTLKVGDCFIVGDHYGRVRAMFDDQGRNISNAEPSTPVEVLGLGGLPQAGDTFKVVADERLAREISAKRQLLKRERDTFKRPTINLENLFDKIQSGLGELNLIIKADMMGSVEALSDALLRLSNSEVQVRILHQSIGAISENDVNLAAASDAIIVGFHVTANSAVRDLARQENVEIRQYRIIFEAVEDLKKALEGLLKPEVRESIIGSAEVRQVFTVPKIGTIAGSFVKEGVIRRNALVRVIRDGIQIQQDSVSSLRRFKDDAREVQAGYECGIGLQSFSDIKPGDMLEFFIKEEIARKLE